MNPLSYQSLLKAMQVPISDQSQMSALLATLFNPRFIDIADTSLAIGETHRGAILRFTSNSAITVTLPVLDSGFLFGFLPYGTGTITFSGTTLGGTTSSGQNVLGSGMLLTTGEWLMSGVSA